MKKMAVVLSLVSGLAMAQPDSGAFALRRPIVLPADASLVSLSLPADVYQVVRRADLGDVRILNGAGESVPMALMPVRSMADEVRRERTLVALPSRAAVQNPALVVSAQGAGGSVQVEITGHAAPAQTASPGYLIDTGEEASWVDAIELDWAGEPVFEAGLRVSASDDLTHWRPLTDTAVLLAAGAGEARIEHRRITLSPVNARYLRLEWRDAPPAVVLTGATLVDSRKTASPPREWIDLPGEREGDAVRYVSPGLFPVDAITLVPANPADVLVAEVASRAEPTQRWRPRGRLQAYRLTQQGQTLEAAAQAIPRTRDPLWQLAFVGGVPAGALPALRLGWHPETVVFVTRGPGPYQLVAGNASIMPTWQPAGSLIPGFGTPAEVQALPARLGPADGPVAAAPRAESPWQESSQWLLWGALLLGVGVLGMMARGLMRELSSGGGADKP